MDFSWIQKDTLAILLRKEAAKAKDLTPKDVAPNAFAYHLNGLIAAKIIEKQGRGTYKLTDKGHKVAGKFSTATYNVTEEIKTVIMLYAKQNNQYLLFHWSRQPYLGKITLIYDRVPLGKSLEEGILSATQDKIGFIAPTKYKRSALVKIRKNNLIVSHMNALIYEVNLDHIVLPYNSRNGKVFVSDLSDPNIMNGVIDFLKEIENGNEPLETNWRY